MSPQPLRSDVRRPWRADDTDLARLLWQQIRVEARVFLTVLASHPNHRFLAAEIVAQGRLDRAANQAHVVLGGTGTFCRNCGVEQIWRYDTRSPRSYWAVQAELILRAHDDVVQGGGTQTALGDVSDIFTGQLSRLAETDARGEQQPLRQRLLNDRDHGTCAVCSRDFPISFLVAAHIKQRSHCTEDGQRDWDDIAMLACLFGCDKLYEDGYLCADESGGIQVRDCPAGPVFDRLQPLRGRKCSAHRPENAAYFAWHRENVFVSA